jgi:hypothetical protein
MIGRTKAIKTLMATVTVLSCLILPAYPQGLGKKGGGYAGPPVDTHPKVDEKAYKAALDHIPAPKEKYDPWGIAHPPESAKTGKNQTRDEPR